MDVMDVVISVCTCQIRTKIKIRSLVLMEVGHVIRVRNTLPKTLLQHVRKHVGWFQNGWPIKIKHLQNMVKLQIGMSPILPQEAIYLPVPNHSMPVRTFSCKHFDLNMYFDLTKHFKIFRSFVFTRLVQMGPLFTYKWITYV